MEPDFVLARRSGVATLGQDLRYAIRRMKRTPGFTAVAIATLALGLGLNSAVWSLANALFLKPLPLDDARRLVLVDQALAWRPEQAGFTLSYPDYLHYRDHSRMFADLAAHYSTSPMHVSTADGGFDLTGSVVTANYFHVLRLKPALGRFSPPTKIRCQTEIRSRFSARTCGKRGSGQIRRSWTPWCVSTARPSRLSAWRRKDSAASSAA
jgi:hypothetical protein